MRLSVLTFTMVVLVGISALAQEVKLSREIKLIVHQMIKYDRIDTEAIGFGGTKTKQYDRFIKLTERASIVELILLTDHKSPVIRGYSFWSLAKKYYPNLEEIYKKHINDTEKVDQIDGCIGGEIPLIGFMSWVVTPNVLDVNCKKLDLNYH